MRANDLIIGLILLGALGCTKEAEKPPAPIQKVSATAVRINSEDNLKFEDAVAKPFPESIEFSGRITVPDKDIVTLSARVSGRLESLVVSVGDRVSAGGSVGSIWSSDLATASEEYAMALKEGGNMLALTKRKLEALGVSVAELAPGKTTFSLRSPITGVVLEKKVNSGASLNPGDAILTIGRLDSVQFMGDLPPDLAVQVKPQMKILFDDAPELTAKVESVSPISDPSTHLVKMRAKFSQALPKELPQESYLKGRIVLREVPSLVIPAKSLILLGETEYVFLQSEKDPKIYERVAIHVTNRTKTEIAISAETLKRDHLRVLAGGALQANDVLEDEAEKN